MKSLLLNLITIALTICAVITSLAIIGCGDNNPKAQKPVDPAVQEYNKAITSITKTYGEKRQIIISTYAMRFKEMPKRSLMTTEQDKEYVRLINERLSLLEYERKDMRQQKHEVWLKLKESRINWQPK